MQIFYKEEGVILSLAQFNCNVHLTQQGENKILNFLNKSLLERNRFIERYNDSVDDTPFPTIIEILDDIKRFYDKETETYYAKWGLTDTHDSEPLILKRGDDFDFIQ